MNADAYVKTVLSVIAVALVAIAAHLWAERLVPSPAEAQADGADPARRISAIERVQKQQTARIEILRAALQSTVINATRRGYFPDDTWSTIYWNPDVPPAAGG
jgi:hypothetical protein